MTALVPSLLTVREAAALSGVGADDVYRACRAGRLRAVKVGRSWRIPVGAVRAWAPGDTPVTARVPVVDSVCNMRQS